MAFITIAGQNQIAKKQGDNVTLNIASFVLANVPDLGSEPATRIESIPNEHVVDQLVVTKSGYVNTNQVVYSLVMGSDIGNYSFNWVGLVDDEGVLIAVTYIPLTPKTKNDGGVPGNTFTRNFLISYIGIQQTTAITVPAETWQIDFSARLSGIDERERLANFDIYGHEGFLGDGWKVTGSAGTYSVAAGIGYVGGVRAKNTAPQQITTSTFPNEIWLNVSLQGDISDMAAVCKFVIDTGPFAHYVDGNGIEHYLTKIATIDAVGEVTDGRGVYDPRDANTLDKKSSSYYRNASNLNAGTVPIEQLPLRSSAIDVSPFKVLITGDGGIVKTETVDYSRLKISGFSRVEFGASESPNPAYRFISMGVEVGGGAGQGAALFISELPNAPAVYYYCAAGAVYSDYIKIWDSVNLTKSDANLVSLGIDNVSFVTPKALKDANIVDVADKLFGVDQTRVDVTDQRLDETEYINTDSKSILMILTVGDSGVSGALNVTIGGITTSITDLSVTDSITNWIILPGEAYMFELNGNIKKQVLEIK